MSLPAKITTLEGIIDAFVTVYNGLVQSQLNFANVTDLLADNGLTGDAPDGEIVRILDFDGFDLVKVASGLVHYTAASGATFRLRMDRASPMMLGAIGDGVADDASALDLVLGTDAMEIDLLGRDYVHSGTWAPAIPVFNGRVTDTNGLIDYRLLTEARIATNAEAIAGAPGTKVVSLDGLAALVQTLIDAIPVQNIVQTAFTDIALYAAATSIELAELRTSITIQKDASDVKVTMMISYDRANNAVFRITRNGVDIFQNTEASPGARYIGVASVNWDSDGSSTLQSQTIQFLDRNVGDAGAFEYRIHVEGGSASFALNRTIGDGNGASYERASSFVMLEEIITAGA